MKYFRLKNIQFYSLLQRQIFWPVVYSITNYGLRHLERNIPIIIIIIMIIIPPLISIPMCDNKHFLHSYTFSLVDNKENALAVV